VRWGGKCAVVVALTSNLETLETCKKITVHHFFASGVYIFDDEFSLHLN
jgi:hypothetical protein